MSLNFDVNYIYRHSVIIFIEDNKFLDILLDRYEILKDMYSRTFRFRFSLVSVNDSMTSF